MAKSSKRNGDATQVTLFGCRDDDDDDRDADFSDMKLGRPLSAERAERMRNLEWPPAWQQLPLNSCTAHAVAGALWYVQARDDEDRPPVDPSRMYLFYHGLVYQRDENVDADEELVPSLEATTEEGVSIRNALKAAARYGACQNCYWAHPTLDIRHWDFDKVIERQGATVDGATFQALRASPDEALYDLSGFDGVWVKTYSRLSEPTVANFETALAHGCPVIFSLEVRDSLGRTGADGLVAIPKADEQSLGTHAMVAIGYDKERKIITARNSWGPYWGDHGLGHFPYHFFAAGRIRDAWALHTVERTDTAASDGSDERPVPSRNAAGLRGKKRAPSRGRKKKR
jgi:hypothetical protein